MRFWPLLLANLGRHKRRTFLTMASVALALFLFASLRTVITTLRAAADFGSARRLVSTNASGLIFPLPVSYAQRLATIPEGRSDRGRQLRQIGGAGGNPFEVTRERMRVTFVVIRHQGGVSLPQIARGVCREMTAEGLADVGRPRQPGDPGGIQFHVAVTDSARCAAETLDFIRRSAKRKEARA